MTIEWRTIPDFPAYQVSDAGEVRSWLRMQGKPVPRVLGQFLNTTSTDAGRYLRVNMRLGGRDVVRLVHSLVLLTFVGPRPPGQEARHLDGDRFNNSLANLAYGTHSENTLDQVRHGTHNMASKTHCRHGHPLDAANTYIHPKGGSRDCRTCRRAAVRKSQQARQRVDA